MSDKVKGYKGFNKEFQCTPTGDNIFQYEVGKEYKEEKADLCNIGFHFCENPIDTFRYYSPSDGRYCEVEAENVSEQEDADSKRCAQIIRIGAEIGIKGIIDAFVKFTLEKIDWNNNRETNTGYYSAATNTGYCSAATNTGYCSAATNTGYCSAATVEGDSSIACALGYNCKAKGIIGSAIVIAERDNNLKLINIKASIIDGKKIKENVFYKLADGKFIEAE